MTRPLEETSREAPDKWGKVRARELFLEYGQSRQEAARNELVTMYLNLVKYVVVRYADRGEPMEDLYQVGCVGLVKAIDRFDPRLGNQFTTFAIPTIVGEIKRYFRDKAWAMRVPRRLQDLKLAVNRMTEKLTSGLGRIPSVSEIATALGATEEDVLTATELGQMYSTLSLDTEIVSEHGRDATNLKTFLGEDDEDLRNVDQQVMLEQALVHLAPRERLVVHLRFFQNYSQKEAAHVLGVSQMHISRLQARAISHLKVIMEDECGEKGTPGKSKNGARSQRRAVAPS